MTITPGTATAVEYVSPSLADLASGSTRTFTARIRDAAGNTVTGYVGTMTFTQNAGPGTTTGLPSGPITVVNGLATSGAITGVLVGNVTVRASSAALATADTSFTVVPGAASGATTTISASPTGVSVDVGSSTITVQAKDQDGNNLVSSGGTVLLSADFGSLSAVIDNGNGTYSATLTDTVTRTDTVSGSINALAITDTASVTFTPGTATSLEVSGFPPTTTAGVTHGFTVVARDAFNNIATGYTGTVTFTSSDAAATLPSDYTFTGADAGVQIFSAALRTAGTQSITATDTVTASITGTQTAIVVGAAAAANLSITLTPDTITADGVDTTVVSGTSPTSSATRASATRSPSPAAATSSARPRPTQLGRLQRDPDRLDHGRR